MRVVLVSCCALLLVPFLIADGHAAGRVELLAGPVTGGGPEAAARAALAARPQLLAGVPVGDLVVEHVTRTADGGAAVRLRQHAHVAGAAPRGLRVLGQSVTVRLDGAGRARWARSSVAPVGPLALPQLDAARALDLALADGAHRIPLAGLPGARPEVARHVEEIVYAPGGGVPAVRAFLIVTPRNLAALQTLRFVIDAATGQVIARENLVLHDRLANVYDQNPILSVRGVATLPGLAPGATALASADVIAQNCLDLDKCIPLMGAFIHLCTPTATAIADGSGDFTAYDFVGDLEAEDTFAEVQMYFHTAKIYAAFRAWASDAEFSLDARPLAAVANFRIPAFEAIRDALCGSEDYTGTGELVFFDNAAFFPQGGLFGTYPPEDMILFGQGTRTDFAYDGDAVYHEFGHGVMKAVTPLFGVMSIKDALGRDSSPGGMNEGYADYFSSALTGDSVVGDYALAPLGGARDLANEATCPDALWGEVHQDSVPWTGALWAIRTGLTVEQRPVFDRAVYVAMTALDGSDGFGTAMEATLAEVTTVLGVDVAATARAIFVARSIDDCDGRLLHEPGKLVVYAAGGAEVGANLAPTAFQWTFDVPAGRRAMHVEIQASQDGGAALFGGGPNLSLLVKPGAAPIAWDWTTPNSPTHDAPFTGQITLAADGTGSGVAYGELPEGPVHLMLANGGGGVILRVVTFNATDELPPPDAAPMPDAGGADAAGPGADGGGGGCGCRVAGRADRGGAAWAGLLVGLAILGGVTRRGRRARRAA